MKAGGRPLRFLAVVMGGWTITRVALLWPVIDSPAALIGAVVPGVAAAERSRPPPAMAAPPVAAHAPPSAAIVGPRARVAIRALRPADPDRIALAALAMLRFGAERAVPLRPTMAQDGSLPLAPRPAVADRRWSGSAWLVLRGRGANGAAFGGSQLGGSQAGLRLAYTIDPRHRLALAGRIATPLGGSGSEAAIGLEWQPLRAPVRLVAEQRIALDGGKGGPTLGVVGGYGPAPVAPGVTIEAYGQAGAIARQGIDGFADGAVRIAHPVATLGRTRFDLGAGAWGGAQRGAARLDIGPSLAADLPLGAVAHARLSLDWRQRIAGDARPGSGLVLSLGTDF